MLLIITIYSVSNDSTIIESIIIHTIKGYLKRYQSGLFVPALPSFKVEVIDTLKYGTVNKIFLEFEKPFWDLTNPGFQFLHAGDEVDNSQISDKDWIKSIIGFDAVLKQPNMLLGWIAGPTAK